jgi:high affinity choline transporter 7
MEASGGITVASWGEALTWSDWSIILILGGIPWNVYFQRVLSSRDEDAAAKTSMIAGVLCALMAIPPVLLGLAGRAIDWSTIDTGSVDAVAALAETPAMILPFLLRYAVPEWVAILGMGAVAAAVMSSVDSSILSASSLLAWNGYRRLVNPNASAQAITRMVRIGVVVLGGAAMVIALTVSSVSALWYLCGDVVYCVLFPQLTLALFDKKANRTGAMVGLLVSTVVRLSGGDTTLGLPGFFPWPAIPDGEFPFRTTAMVLGVLTALIVSRLTAKQDPPKPLGPLDSQPVGESRMPSTGVIAKT